MHYASADRMGYQSQMGVCCTNTQQRTAMPQYPEDSEVDWVDFILEEPKDSILAWEVDLVYQDSVFLKDNLDLEDNNPDSEDNIQDKDLLKVNILLRDPLQDSILLKDNTLVNLKDHLKAHLKAHLQANGLA